MQDETYKGNAQIRELFGVPDDPVERMRELERRKQEALARGAIQVTQRRVGRNDPCPCGSGGKFKHCCIGQVWRREIEI